MHWSIFILLPLALVGVTAFAAVFVIAVRRQFQKSFPAISDYYFGIICVAMFFVGLCACGLLIYTCSVVCAWLGLPRLVESPRQLGIAAVVLAVLVPVAATVTAIRLYSRRLSGSPECLYCHFSLRGHEGALAATTVRCPECGQVMETAHVRSRVTWEKTLLQWAKQPWGAFPPPHDEESDEAPRNAGT